MQVQANPTITKQQSTILMKKLVQASIGSISYIRMLFPDNSFSTKGMDGIAVKFSIANSRVVNNELMNKYMNGVFDAMERKYLKTVVFGIYEQGKEENLIESYEFSFDYDNSQFSLNDSIVDVQKNTRMFMKRLLVMTQNLEPLPGSIV